MGARRRLERLEQEHLNRARQGYTTPIEVRVHLKTMARIEAQLEEKPIPPWTEEELSYQFEEDLLSAQGKGDIHSLRISPGWDKGRGATLLDVWEEEAKRRVAAVAAAESAGRDWREIYEADRGWEPVESQEVDALLGELDEEIVDNKDNEGGNIEWLT